MLLLLATNENEIEIIFTVCTDNGEVIALLVVLLQHFD